MRERARFIKSYLKFYILLQNESMSEVKIQIGITINVYNHDIVSRPKLLQMDEKLDEEHTSRSISNI
jgi:hypothetical protein